METLYAATRAALRDALTTSFHAGDLQAATGAARFVLYMDAIAERETILRSVRRFATEVMPLMGVGENAAG